MNPIRQRVVFVLQKLGDWLKDRYLPRLQLQPIHILRAPHRTRADAFTMIEIAISLAVIGFALVAIIGILPSAMTVQKENRQETIINQDASVFINAIRGGQRGLDDLTNYVVAITNLGTRPAWYTFNGSSENYPITNGLRIIGLLSTPRYDGFRSNYIVAHVRSLSGLASEKYPQQNPEVQDFSLAYRLIMEVLPATTNTYYWALTNFTDPTIAGNTNLIIQRSNAWRLARTVETNYHDLRLTFRYPYQAGRVGNGRLLYRTTVSGRIIRTNEPGFLNIGQRLFFFEPHTYTQVFP